MADTTVYFLHGFASSSKGIKGQFFQRRFENMEEIAYSGFDFNPTPQDFEYMTVSGMINRLRQQILVDEAQTAYLIGSSMGGLVALQYAQRFGGIARLLLLAPALVYRFFGRVDGYEETWRTSGVTQTYHYEFQRPLPLRYDLHHDGALYQQAPPPPAPIVIIHGAHDEIIPVHSVRAYAADYPVRVTLLEVEAGHDLNNHLELIWEQVEQFLVSDSAA